MRKKNIIVIGIGEEGLDGLPITSRQLIKQADILVGGIRHLSKVTIGNEMRVDWSNGIKKALDIIESYYNSLGLEIKYHNYKNKSKFKKQFIQEIRISKNSSLNINNLPIIGLTEAKLISVFGGQKEKSFDWEHPHYHYTYLQKNAHFNVDFYFDSKGELDEIYIRFGKSK